jgi:ATP-dependent exoDNAse (exonuclease V) beta subunit
VITDINPDAVKFATEIRQRLEDLLYVGMTRANFQVVLLIEEGLYPNA